MPDVTLIPLRRDDLPTLENLLQLYLYDFSPYLCDDPDEQIGEDGRYNPGFNTARYAGRHGYWGYLARVDGRLAGFSLVSDRVRYRPIGRHVDEFFVLRCYRRRGVGRAMAFQTFDTYRGYWEITEIAPNLPAIAFWQTVIDSYTGGRFRDFTEVWGEQVHPIQTFDSSTW